MAKKTAAGELPGMQTTAVATVKKPMAIAKIDASEWQLINDETSLEAMIYNLQGESLSEFDLDRIKVPSGGGAFFQVPTAEGIQALKEVTGILLHIGIRRSYWVDPNPTGVPPSCYSTDGLLGIGEPGGDCGPCPFNQFGSGVKSDGKQAKGKRCREMRVMLIIRPEDRLPLVVMAPPASIKGVKQFLMRLPVFMFQAVTKFTLVPDKADGVPYSKVVPEFVGAIDLQAAKRLAAYAETIKKVLTGKAPQAADFGDDEETEQVEGEVVEASTVPQGGAENLPE